MRALLCVAALAVGATTTALAQPAKPPTIDAKAVVWTLLPTGADVARLYPRKALAAMINVSAVVDCTIRDGVLEDCSARDESLKGFGIGEAAIALVQLSHMQMTTRDGQPVEGGKISLPVAFKMPPSADAQSL